MDHIGGAGIRTVVLDSWHRSAAAGVGVDVTEAPVTLPGDELHERRSAHRLASVFPLLDEVLGQAAVDCDAVMAVTDEVGQLLWVCGNSEALARAESIGFVEGSNWDERLAGTNAPGLALALDQPAVVTGHEHFRHSVQRWNCVASPIHDPVGGTILGVLDITGGAQIDSPQTVAMVRAAARMAEAELARQAARAAADARFPLQRGGHPAGTLAAPPLHLETLGRHTTALTVLRPGRPARSVTLSPRHSEILLLLAAHPAGLSGEELAILLYDGDPPVGTLRAELNRLRHLLGEELVLSRPYRLATEASGDWRTVEALLVAGDVAAAVRRYRGPVLPHSHAPGVAAVRDSLEAELRHAVLASGDPLLMATWTRSPWGADDREMWIAQERVLRAGSPLVALARGQIRRLDRELGL